MAMKLCRSLNDFLAKIRTAVILMPYVVVTLIVSLTVVGCDEGMNMVKPVLQEPV